jgi:hypothetical protein
MSRLDAVVRVLKATGKALHYNIITRQALQQGIIRFTGSQGTAGESMKAFLNKTIRENKTAAIVNMGKGVYGLKVPSSLSLSVSLSQQARARRLCQRGSVQVSLRPYQGSIKALFSASPAETSKEARSQAISRLRQDEREKEREREGVRERARE